MTNISNKKEFDYKSLFNKTVPINVPTKSTEHIDGTVEGWVVHTDDEGRQYMSGELAVRVNPTTFTKAAERYFKNFMCLNPNSQLSRIYVIPKEIVRQNVEGEVIKRASKKSKSKR